MKNIFKPEVILINLIFFAYCTAQTIFYENFESDLGQWTNTTNGSIVSYNPHSGAGCLKLTDTTTADEIQLFSQHIDVSPDSHYILTFWHRSEIINNASRLVINQFGEDSLGTKVFLGGRNLLVNFSSDSTWSLFRVRIKNLDSATVAIKIVLSPTDFIGADETFAETGVAYFDDIELKSIVSTYENEYIHLISRGNITILQSPIEYKTIPGNIVPSDTSDKIMIHAAKGEYEPFQLVIQASLTDDILVGINKPLLKNQITSEIIHDSNITIRSVDFINVTRPTDAGSYTGWVPDPLPTAQLPLNICDTSQGRNIQPLWITVYVPRHVSSGIYEDSISLNFQNAGLVKIPISLRVWNFELPERASLSTIFGLDFEALKHFHKLGNDTGTIRNVFYRYLTDFYRHRINPQKVFLFNKLYTFFHKDKEVKTIWNGGETTIDSSHTSNPVIQLLDTSTENVEKIQSSLFHFTNNGDYRFKIDFKSDQSGFFDVIICQYYGSGHHIPSNNIHFQILSDTSWQSLDTIIPNSSFHGETKYIHIDLNSSEWNNPSVVRSVFFDNICFGPTDTTDFYLHETFSPFNPDSISITTYNQNSLDAVHYALDSLKFNLFELEIPILGKKHEEKFLSPTISCYSWYSDEFKQLFNRYVRSIANYLETEGIKNNAFVYWYDEPKKEDFDKISYGMELLYNADSTIKCLQTFNRRIEPNLIDNVNFWVPLTNYYNHSWAQKKRSENDEVWWYVCTQPKIPFANYFIDHPGIEPRILSWMCWKYNVNGILYWDVNDKNSLDAHHEDPWEFPENYRYDGFFYGNGDGRLIYPPKNWKTATTPLIEDPTPSIRWELIREGLEDYDYFYLLKTLADSLAAIAYTHEDSIIVENALSLLQISDSIITNLASYTDNPNVLSNQRYRIAAMIDSLFNEQDRIEGIEVYAKDEGFYEYNFLKPRIYIKNNGFDTLTDFQMCIFITIEDSNIVPIVEKWYAPNAEVELSRIDSLNYCVTYEFSGVTILPGDIYPDISGSVIGIHYPDWSYFNKTNDFSRFGTDFQLNNTVALYDKKGRLIFGSAPGSN